MHIVLLLSNLTFGLRMTSSNAPMLFLFDRLSLFRRLVIPNREQGWLFRVRVMIIIRVRIWVRVWVRVKVRVGIRNSEPYAPSVRNNEPSDLFRCQDKQIVKVQRF